MSKRQNTIKISETELLMFPHSKTAALTGFHITVLPHLYPSAGREKRKNVVIILSSSHICPYIFTTKLCHHSLLSSVQQVLMTSLKSLQSKLSSFSRIGRKRDLAMRLLLKLTIRVLHQSSAQVRTRLHPALSTQSFSSKTASPPSTKFLRAAPLSVMAFKSAFLFSRSFRIF